MGNVVSVFLLAHTLANDTATGTSTTSAVSARSAVGCDIGLEGVSVMNGVLGRRFVELFSVVDVLGVINEREKERERSRGKESVSGEAR